MLSAKGTQIDGVLDFVVPDSLLVSRQRWGGGGFTLWQPCIDVPQGAASITLCLSLSYLCGGFVSHSGCELVGKLWLWGSVPPWS